MNSETFGEWKVGKGKLELNNCFEKIGEMAEGSEVRIRGRKANIRKTGKMVFAVLRKGLETVQLIMNKKEKSEEELNMINFFEQINGESYIEIEGILRNGEVKNCSLKNKEVEVKKVFVISKSETSLVSVEDCERSYSEVQDSKLPSVSLDTRLNNRLIDLRTKTNHSILGFRMKVVQIMRDYMIKNGLTEINSPKLIGCASEGGSQVFKVNYYKRDAYLAQSPQLYKQMMMISDYYEGVFEFGTIWRAELSDTHRHLSEFSGVDLERCFDQSYEEVMHFIINMFVDVFKKLESDPKIQKLINNIHQQYPVKHPFTIDYNNILILAYSEAIDLLNKHDSTLNLPADHDLSSEQERLLGSIIYEKYKTDFYVINNYPRSLRPFYTQPNPTNENLTNSYDFFIRGEEILSGAQRIHSYDKLLESLKKYNIDPETISFYLESFKFGAPPHAGCGIGLDRVIFLYLGLPNVRLAVLYPRDVKRIAP